MGAAVLLGALSPVLFPGGRCEALETTAVDKVRDHQLKSMVSKQGRLPTMVVYAATEVLRDAWASAPKLRPLPVVGKPSNNARADAHASLHNWRDTLIPSLLREAHGIVSKASGKDAHTGQPLSGKQRQMLHDLSDVAALLKQPKMSLTEYQIKAAERVIVAAHTLKRAAEPLPKTNAELLIQALPTPEMLQKQPERSREHRLSVLVDPQSGEIFDVDSGRRSRSSIPGAMYVDVIQQNGEISFQYLGGEHITSEPPSTWLELGCHKTLFETARHWNEQHAEHIPKFTGTLRLGSSDPANALPIHAAGGWGSETLVGHFSGGDLKQIERQLTGSNRVMSVAESITAVTDLVQGEVGRIKARLAAWKMAEHPLLGLKGEPLSETLRILYQYGAIKDTPRDLVVQALAKALALSHDNVRGLLTKVERRRAGQWVALPEGLSSLVGERASPVITPWDVGPSEGPAQHFSAMFTGEGTVHFRTDQTFSVTLASLVKIPMSPYLDKVLSEVPSGHKMYDPAAPNNFVNDQTMIEAGQVPAYIGRDYGIPDYDPHSGVPMLPISRNHAAISLKPDGTSVVKDLGSSYGTVVEFKGHIVGRPEGAVQVLQMD